MPGKTVKAAKPAASRAVKPALHPRRRLTPAQQAMAAQYKGYPLRAAKKLGFRSDDQHWDDVVSVGYEALCLAALTFDPRRPHPKKPGKFISFSSYAHTAVRRACSKAAERLRARKARFDPQPPLDVEDSLVCQEEAEAGLEPFGSLQFLVGLLPPGEGPTCARVADGSVVGPQGLAVLRMALASPLAVTGAAAARVGADAADVAPVPPSPESGQDVPGTGDVPGLPGVPPGEGSGRQDAPGESGGGIPPEVPDVTGADAPAAPPRPWTIPEEAELCRLALMGRLLDAAGVEAAARLLGRPVTVVRRKVDRLRRKGVLPAPLPLAERAGLAGLAEMRAECAAEGWEVGEAGGFFGEALWLHRPTGRVCGEAEMFEAACEERKRRERAASRAERKRQGQESGEGRA